RDVLVADEPVEFADHVIKLLDSPGKRYEIGRNAANYVRRNHDWGEIAEKLASIYQEAAEVFGAKKGRSSL
ncbi:MAG TPA: glycosyltransferase, partial [Armatimonadota bacterium]|nr:glycosyltransferase [Armatimonadota bacterium]